MHKFIKVKLSGEESKHTKEFNCYHEGVVLDSKDPILNDYVEHTKKESKGHHDGIEVIIKMIWI